MLPWVAGITTTNYQVDTVLWGLEKLGGRAVHYGKLHILSRYFRPLLIFSFVFSILTSYNLSYYVS